ncbi:MAG: envelope stress response membrane protein PspB [Rhodospirillales bacterium]
MNWDLFTIFAFVIVWTVVRGHYKRQATTSAGMSNGDQSALSAAMEAARRLEQRVETLERLLDEDAPGWRSRARA